jgi:hypothetical protein
MPNLRWATPKENAVNKPDTSTAVIQIDAKTGKEIDTFNSQKEATEKLNIPSSNICRALKSPTRTAGGYKWKYVDENNLIGRTNNNEKFDIEHRPLEYPGYEITKNGDVWSNKFKMYLAQGINTTGYKTVGLNRK